MLKWLFFWKNKSHPGENNCALTALYEGDRGISELHHNDAELRLWLPEPLRIALHQTVQETGCQESQYLREFLVVYLYGVHELLQMRTHKTGLYFVPPPKSYHTDIRFSRVALSEVIPGLGKNIIPCKLRLPSKLKADLQDLADKNGIPLGRFIREILVQHFLGHTVWPGKLDDRTEQEVADDWVNGLLEPYLKPIEQVDVSLEAEVDEF
ncbi:hypothetical protein A1359_02255 [Methylomonas lenta]|uniref:Uncharacterized protein n=1 Tax=Methylomonas lenta TaxID=980561 RepID=A0A177MUN0_9GAMM|nr:hypothetical protein [Methylomonas lenta]OAI09361.1 hypothetical protein A1359_02255 [Methylomonas lenta]